MRSRSRETQAEGLRHAHLMKDLSAAGMFSFEASIYNAAIEVANMRRLPFKVRMNTDATARYVWSAVTVSV